MVDDVNLFLSFIRKSPIYGPSMDDFDEAVLKEGRMTDDFEPNSEIEIQSNTGTPDVKSDSQSEAVFDASFEASLLGQDKPSGSVGGSKSVADKDGESSGRMTLKLKKILCKMIAVSFGNLCSSTHSSDSPESRAPCLLYTSPSPRDRG